MHAVFASSGADYPGLPEFGQQGGRQTDGDAGANFLCIIGRYGGQVIEHSAVCKVSGYPYQGSGRGGAGRRQGRPEYIQKRSPVVALFLSDNTAIGRGNLDKRKFRGQYIAEIDVCSIRRSSVADIKNQGDRLPLNRCRGLGGNQQGQGRRPC